MSNIYELPQEIEKALSNYYGCFDEETGELVVEEEVFKKVEAELFELQNQKQELLEWYLKDRANRQADNAGLQNEIARLQARIDRNNKKIQRVEKIVDYNFKENYNWKPTHYGSFTVSYRKSKATIIENEDLIPVEFIKEKITHSVDKTAIKKIIETGAVVPWAKIEERLNLSIK